MPSLPKNNKTQKDNASNGEVPSGRKQSLPALLSAKHGSQAPSIEGNGQESLQLEDYNALERLLEAGNSEDLDTRTELNELQIFHYARAEVLAKYHDSRILGDFVESLKRKQISLKRKGRKEFVSAFQSANMSEGEYYAQGVRSIADKLRS